MKDLRKAAKLREAQELLDRALVIIEGVLGGTDSGASILQDIEDARLDLSYDIMEFEGAYE